MKKFLLLLLCFFFFFSQNNQVKAAEIEEVIIYPENLPICNDFDIEYHRQSESTGSGLPGPDTKELKEFTGELRVDKADFPDFSAMETNLLQALERILPGRFQKEMAFDEKPLETKIAHFVIGQDEDGNPLESQAEPETTFSQPGWFTKLLGETKVLCGLLGTCPAPSSLNIKVAQPAIEAPIALQGFCSINQNVLGQPIANLPNPDDNQIFIVSTLWKKFTKILAEILENVFKRQTTETANFKKQSRGPLVGAQTLSKQVTFADAILPDLGLKGNQQTSSPADFYLSEGYSILGSEDLGYPLGKVQKSFCLMICSIHPANINIAEEFPFCHSCDPDDYPLDPNFGTSLDDIPLDMSLCQRDPVTNACHYYNPSDGPRCDGDPICESGRCNPYEYRLRRDYTDRGCSPPYSTEHCNDPAVCRTATFQSNPAGGFGFCQYQNATVCVRTDRVAVDSCAAVCNWACCAWQ